MQIIPGGPEFKKSGKSILSEGLSNLGQAVKKGCRGLVNTISDIVGTKTQTTQSETTQTYQIEKVSLCGGEVSKKEIQAIDVKLGTYYRQNEIFVSDVLDIYDSIEDDLIQIIIDDIDPIEGTYEEILKKAMDKAAFVNNPIIAGYDALPSVVRFLDRHFRLPGSVTGLMNIPVGVQRYSLAIIWSSLLYSIFRKYASVSDFQKKSIVRAGISLTLGVGVSFIQYYHRKPDSITNYLRMLYEGYDVVRNLYNRGNTLLFDDNLWQFEKLLPDFLNIAKKNKDFSSMTGEEKVTAGQSLNMTYTFRIGDVYLTTLEKGSFESSFSRDLLRSITTSVLPWPLRWEIEKMYKLYKEKTIYNIN